MITQPSVWGQFTDLAANGIFRLVGVGPPSSATGAAFAAPGSEYIDTLTGIQYFQAGTIATPAWIAVAGPQAVQQLTGVITPANIIGTAAGQFGHANGVIMVPAGGAHIVTELVSVVIHCKFAVAAYTAGGNITAQSTGTILTGLVSAANSLGSATSKSNLLPVLSTIGVPLTENGPINLVSSAAFTNPGTAAGTLTWIVNFRQYATGF